MRVVRAIERAGVVACFVVAVASVLPAVSDLDKLGSLTVGQFIGPAQGTDFLNLYAGADLMLRAPRDLYDPAAQLAVQSQLTGAPRSLAPFLLPPYAAVLLGWIALQPFATAYLVWLMLGLGCVCLSAAWLAPRWGGRGYPLVWLGISLLYLPAFEGLAEGQTAALMLLAFAGVCRLVQQRRQRAWPLTACLLTWAFKPQLAPWLILMTLAARGSGAVIRLAAVLVVLSCVAVVLVRPAGVGAYVQLSHQKLLEVLSPDTGLLEGPTLLHAAGWMLGNGWPAQLVATSLVGAAALAFWVIWRNGVAGDDALLLQLAAVPVISVVCAPYALVHELTAWLASFWLLWRYTVSRPCGRAGLLWLTAAIWLAGDLGVVMPGSGGSDIAALLGLGLVFWLACLVQSHASAAVSYT